MLRRSTGSKAASATGFSQDGFEPSVPHAKGSVFLAVGEELGVDRPVS
jgi:hypothetical protein